jgi:G-patch domain
MDPSSSNSQQDEESQQNETPVTLPEREDIDFATGQMENSPSPVTENTPSAGTPLGRLKFSFAQGKAPTTKSEQKQPSRPSDGITAFHMHGESDSDEESGKSFITSVEADAAVHEESKNEKTSQIIQPPKSHNEHSLQKRSKMFRLDMVDKTPKNLVLSGDANRIGDDEVKVGLQVSEKPSRRLSPTADNSEAMLLDETPKTEDELALEMLLRQAQNPHESISMAPKLVIPAHPSESDVYAYDMARLSDAPTLATYERVPVESFGMGILLGLGWKEGTDLQGQHVESLEVPKKRPDFLGMGAEEEEFLRVDAKGRKVSRKVGLGASWNPLKKIDKKTGEVVVEEEDSRRSTSRERSAVSTPQARSRYGTQTRGRSGERGRDVRGRSSDDRDRWRDTHRSEEHRSRRDGTERSYDLDREWRRDREHDSGRRSRDQDSDHHRNQRRDIMERSENGSRRESRRPSPQSTRGRSPQVDDRRRGSEDGECSNTGNRRETRRPRRRRERSRSPQKDK